MADKHAEVARKAEALRQEQGATQREQIEDQVAERLAAERGQLVAMEAKEARDAGAAELLAQTAEAAELRQKTGVKQCQASRGAAGSGRANPQATGPLMKKKRELDLGIEERVQVSIGDTRPKPGTKLTKPRASVCSRRIKRLN
ncbi:hypothetical protein ACVIIV_003316 [Bradyrhizobium sp. USDA 4354]